MTSLNSIKGSDVGSKLKELIKGTNVFKGWVLRDREEVGQINSSPIQPFNSFVPLIISSNLLPLIGFRELSKRPIVVRSLCKWGVPYLPPAGC